jgi:PAS domain S-box-containing protein
MERGPVRARVRKPSAGREATQESVTRAPDPLEIFSNTADGVMAVNAAGRIVFWNHAAETLLGYAASEVLGRPCYDVMRGRDDHGNLVCHPHCHVLVMALRGEAACAYDLVTRTKEGTERFLNVSTILVPGAGGPIAVHLFRPVASPRLPSEWLAALWETLARSFGPSDVTEDPLARLTAREREVLHLLASGEGTAAIARRLVVSTATVRNHIQRILTKLGVHSRLQAVALAFPRTPAVGTRVAPPGGALVPGPADAASAPQK